VLIPFPHPPFPIKARYPPVAPEEGAHTRTWVRRMCQFRKRGRSRRKGVRMKEKARQRIVSLPQFCIEKN